MYHRAATLIRVGSSGGGLPRRSAAERLRGATILQSNAYVIWDSDKKGRGEPGLLA
jgi:hypothetical protein